MIIELPYRSAFAYDEIGEIAYISGSVNRVISIRTKAVLGTMGKTHFMPPKVTADGKFVAFACQDPIKTDIYQHNCFGNPVFQFRKGHNAVNYESNHRWLDNHRLLTGVEDQAWLLDAATGEQEYCYPSVADEDKQLISTDVYNGEILLTHRVFEGQYAHICITHMKPDNKQWSRQVIRMDASDGDARFDHRGGLFIFSRQHFWHYPCMPGDFNDPHETYDFEESNRIEFSYTGEYCCVGRFHLGGKYSVSLYQTNPWKRVYKEHSPSFISGLFSNLGNWLLIYGKRCKMIPIKEIAAS